MDSGFPPLPATPKVSIVICTYNRGPALRRALASLARLTYANREVIVVDNRSTDETPEVIAAFPVQGVREERQGLSHARNRGIETAGGDAILFFDDDITVECDDFLEQMIATLRSDCRIGMVGGWIRARQEGAGNRTLAELFLPDNGQMLGPSDLQFVQPANLIGASLMFRREAIGDDRFDPELGRRGRWLFGREELDFSARIHAKGWHAAYCPRAVVDHWILGNRFTWSYVIRHEFAEGVSEYLVQGPRFWRRRLHKPLTEALQAVLAGLTLRRLPFARRVARTSRMAGVLCGPLFRQWNAGT